MKTFKYTWNHKQDEQYMAYMCSKGWAMTSVVEGLWTFEKCLPNAYCYRVYYVRGKSKEEFDALKQHLANKGIFFVFRYSFWAYFRSKTSFQLYTPEEEMMICKRMSAPMLPGAIISLCMCIVFIYLTYRFSSLFVIGVVLFGIYGLICARLVISYKTLIYHLQK